MPVKQLLELGNKKFGLFLIIMILCSFVKGDKMQELEKAGIHGSFICGFC